MFNPRTKGIQPPPDMVLKSAPIPVYFAGWQSDTATLGQYGWDMAISKDHNMLRLRVLFHHRGLQLCGYTQDDYDMRTDQPIMIQHVAPAENIQVTFVGDCQMQWVDTEPSYEKRRGTMAELDLFNLKESTVPEVYVEQADMEVVDHLQAILDAQSDKQRELRDKHKRSQESAEEATSKIIQKIVEVA